MRWWSWVRRSRSDLLALLIDGYSCAAGRISPRRLGLAGMCARRRTYFSCVAKKSRQKKATLVSVTPAVPGHPAMLAPGGSRANSLRSNMRVSDSACRCASRHRHKGVENQQPGPTRTRQGASLLNSVFGPHRRVRRRVAQERAEKERRMSEPAGRVCGSPACFEQRSVPCAQHRDDAPGSPSLCLLSFGEAKESTSPAGARPGKPREQTQRKKEKPARKRVSVREGQRRINVPCALPPPDSPPPAANGPCCASGWHRYRSGQPRRGQARPRPCRRRSAGRHA